CGAVHSSSTRQSARCTPPRSAATIRRRAVRRRAPRDVRPRGLYLSSRDVCSAGPSPRVRRWQCRPSPPGIRHAPLRMHRERAPLPDAGPRCRDRSPRPDPWAGSRRPWPVRPWAPAAAQAPPPSRRASTPASLFVQTFPAPAAPSEKSCDHSRNGPTFLLGPVPSGLVRPVAQRRMRRAIARVFVHRYAASGMKARRGTAASPASLLVQVAPDASASLQTQIYDGIRRAILTRVVAGGTLLTSARALAADLGVSRTTTVLALDQLAAEGYVTARQGAGLFVSAELPDEVVAPAGRDVPGRGHPALSARAAALAATPRTAIRAASPPRPFRLGTPALDRFPAAIWTRLVRRCTQQTTFDQLD